MKQITILVVIIGILAGAGFWVISLNKTEPEKTEEVFMEETVEPTETPEPEYEKTDFQIAVLNGGGIAGAAGDMEDVLVGFGYDVVRTGNADSYDYVETVIQVKSNVPEAFVDALKDELSGDYDLASVEELDEDADEDVIVIVGSNGEEVQGATDEATDEETTDEDTTDEETTEEAEPTEEPTPTAEETT